MDEKQMVAMEKEVYDRVRHCGFGESVWLEALREFGEYQDSPPEKIVESSSVGNRNPHILEVEIGK